MRFVLTAYFLYQSLYWGRMTFSRQTSAQMRLPVTVSTAISVYLLVVTIWWAVHQ